MLDPRRIFWDKREFTGIQQEFYRNSTEILPKFYRNSDQIPENW